MSTPETKPRTKEEALDQECPHCAISIFLNAYEDRHPDTTGPGVICGLLEVLADIIDDCPDQLTRAQLVVEAIERFSLDCKSILEGRYKPGKRAQPGQVLQ